MILAGLKTGEIDIGIGRMSDPELMTGLNYELLFLESLKLVVRPNHPLLQENVTLSRVLEWPVVVSPEGTAPRQHSERRPASCHAGGPACSGTWCRRTDWNTDPRRCDVLFWLPVDD